MDQETPATPDSKPSRSTSTVELPATIVDRVEARLARSEFDAVEEYVTFVLEEVLVRVEDATETDRTDAVDRSEIETRLESLGYLD